MRFAMGVARLRNGVARLRTLELEWPSWKTVLRVVLWVVIAAAVGAYLWVLWTESINRR
jgi:hypothetical protein